MVRRHRPCGGAVSLLPADVVYLAGVVGAERLDGAGAPMDVGAEPVVAGAVPVVVAGGLLLAVCGPLPPVPAYHQTPKPISTITMMPMIQPPEPSPPTGRRGEFGLYVDIRFASVGCVRRVQPRAGAMRSDLPARSTGTLVPPSGRLRSI